MVLKKLPWGAKPGYRVKRALTTVALKGVESDPAFCLRPTIEKTNSLKPFH